MWSFNLPFYPHDSWAYNDSGHTPERKQLETEYRLMYVYDKARYLPRSPIYGSRFAFHSRNLNRIKYQLWNSGIEIADWGMRNFRAGLAEDAWDSQQELKRFQLVESQLDELRSYLYANEAAVHDYAKTFREGGRVSSAHVESTINQLINWRFCKKQQMRWTRTGAQGLLHVRTALINGTLSHYSGQPILKQAA